MTGIELLEAVREISPQLPVAVVTAHPSVDYAVRALRNKADEFLEKPVRPDKLVETVTALVAKGRAAREAARQSVLAIGAHPDDVEIGAAGTLAMHRRLGHEVVDPDPEPRRPVARPRTPGPASPRRRRRSSAPPCTTRT